MDKANVQLIPTDQLTFDRKNPRLIEFSISSKTPESEIVSILWDAMDALEIVHSIAQHGFFEHEPLIVSHEDGKNVVIEGNRRLTAVKALLNPKWAEKNNISNLPSISDAVRETLVELPVIIQPRDKAWKFLGFKHINGPQKWSSFAKAQYIAEVHREYKVSLEDIASQIGDTHRIVKRLYRSLQVIEQAEKAKVFNREDIYHSRIFFSHLYTGLQYAGFKKYLGLDDDWIDKDTPVPPGKEEEMEDVFFWLYGSQDDKPVVQTQNPDLRNLDKVLLSSEATVALKSGASLSDAYDESRSDKSLFEEALVTAKQNLLKARARVSGGYAGEDDFMRLAQDVDKLAYDLLQEMKRMSEPSHRG